MNNLIILPHQLFKEEYFKKYNINNITIWEHPQYFTKYKFNKKKIILHRASMKYYYDYLSKLGKYKIDYINFNSDIKLSKSNNYYIFDPIDKINIDKKINNMNIIESPNFILTKKDYEKYRLKTDKFIFNNFYLWSKKHINLYPELKSLDKMNREVYQGNNIPNLPNINKNDKKYIDEAIKYTEKYFSKNYGNTGNFNYPISYESSSKWLDDFIKNKLDLFGPYQDFTRKDEVYMFHSVLSSSINIGLLNPNEIISKISKFEDKVRINSFEGYLRQLFWREYQRYTYIYVDFFKYNYFNNKKKLNSKWYKGNLKIKPIDDLIKSGFDTGYIHHIGRLMFIGNFMNIYRLDPKEGFKWFMEFSCDSYEWVMCQNVLDMVFFVTGGLTMRKPYITKTNYILKNSDYKFEDEWCNKWNQMYDSFLKDNKDKLWKFRYHFPTLKKL